MIVFDSSTLILLAKIELLGKIAEQAQILITEEVKKESTRKESLDAKLITSLIENGRIRIEKVNYGRDKEKLQKDFNIGEGEASTLLLARKRHYALATDDGPTIKVCKIMGIKFITVVHFLIKAYESGILNKELSLAKLEKLRQFGRYSFSIIKDATKRISREDK